MTRFQRYRLVFGLLALAGLLAVAWQQIRQRFPNLFDRESADAAELERLRTADLARPTANTDDWPQFYGPNRDGLVAAPELNPDWIAKPPKTLWSVPCGGGYASLAIVNGAVYTTDKWADKERVLCLDIATGATRWTHEWSVNYTQKDMNYMVGPRATPTIHEGRLYAVGAQGHFVCLQLPAEPLGTPALLWEHDLCVENQADVPRWGIACSPLIEADLVIVQPGGKRGSVVAYDRTSGEQRWATESEPTGYSSPVVGTLAGVRHVVAITGKSVLGIRPTDGKLLWKMPFETQFNGNVALPVLAGNYVFASANYGKGCACFAITATEAGDTAANLAYFRPRNVMQNHFSTSVHRNGFLYGFDGAELRCVNLRTGIVVEDWVPLDQVKRIPKGNVLLLGDSLVSLSESGTLAIGTITPEEYRPAGRLDGVLNGSESWALPAYSRGRLLLRDSTRIVCLDVSK